VDVLAIVLVVEVSVRGVFKQDAGAAVFGRTG